MSDSQVATVVVARPAHLRNRDSWSRPLQGVGAAVGAFMLLAVACISAPPTVVRAVDEPRPGQKVQVADPANQSGVVTELKRALTRQHDRMIDLANQLIGRSHGLDNLNDQLVNQQIKTEAAKANFSNGELTREVAEIAVVEYEQGIFLQDRATVEGELRLAKSDLERARDSIEIAKDRLAKIKQASTGSTSDIANEFTFADILANAERRLPRSELAIRQAESKLKLLVEYTKPKRVMELRSEVEQARSDELAKRVGQELEKSRLKGLQAAIKERDRSARGRKAWELLDRQALAALDRAIPIEEHVRTKLEQLIKNGKPDDPLRKEIQDLTNQLQALVDQAESDRSAARFDELKTGIHKAVN
ncbi:MAG: hypothetical protein ACHRXM_23460 [Isosphaerales bacterium]